MPVMKSHHSPHLRQTAIVMDLSDLETQAAAIVADAKAQAAQILATARAQGTQQSDAIREIARQTGHDEGFAAGHAEGVKQGHDEAVAQTQAGLNELTARWSKTLDLLQQNLPTHLADARLDLVRLSIAIATRITHQEALRNTGVIESTLDDALKLVTGGRSVSLHIHPDEVPAIEAYLPGLLAKLRSIPEIQLAPDDAITPGGCTIHYGSGQIDATLETQIKRIADELLTKQDEPSN